METVEREIKSGGIEHNLIMIDDETGLPVFNPEARTIKEFKELIEKSRLPGMSYNIGKKKATAKMAGVYFFSSYLSMYHNKEEDSRRDAIATQIADLSLDDMLQEDFQKACTRFAELEYVPAVEALEELHAALAISLKFTKIIRRSLENNLVDEDVELTSEQIDLINNQITKLVDLASKIPETQMKVEQALQNVKKQHESKKYKKRKGGKDIHPREI